MRALAHQKSHDVDCFRYQLSEFLFYRFAIAPTQRGQTIVNGFSIYIYIYACNMICSQLNFNGHNCYIYRERAVASLGLITVVKLIL